MHNFYKLYNNNKRRTNQRSKGGLVLMDGKKNDKNANSNAHGGANSSSNSNSNSGANAKDGGKKVEFANELDTDMDSKNNKACK